LTPSGAAAAAKLKTLHSFCTGCQDGAVPLGRVIGDSSGNFFGTTFQAGSNFSGTVYELIATGGGKFKFKVIHEFCTKANCPDGASPFTSLIMDTNGDIYGTTESGGTSNNGTVFELVPNADHSKYKLVTLYNFCPQQPCVDGDFPQAGLTYAGAQNGALYDGTSPLFGTARGGANNSGASGVVYELNFVPGKTKPKEKVLYNFCAQTNCSDGALPSELIIDDQGNLFGTTLQGGTNNQGTAFELSPSGNTFTETVLYRFCTLANCADGQSSQVPLARDSSGNLYGTTEFGGAFNKGTVFKIVPNGGSSTESVLYSFCAQSNCTDGAEPTAGVNIDASGNIIGITSVGGAFDVNGGTIFKISGGTESVLFSFCEVAGCPTGKQPVAGLTADGSGTLFGVTSFGGQFGFGSVFRFTP
jgi:uncharacterized repeat protein (TIGR03803 family)